MHQVVLGELGNIEYGAAWEYQEKLFKELTDRKLRNRDLNKEIKMPLRHYFLLCEHPHVYTLGKGGSMKHLLHNEKFLEEKKISFFKTNRGGDITYHGPGQIVGYPILDLDDFFTDIHKYMRCLEEVIIKTLAEYGITAGRLKGSTGVWLEPDDPVKSRKICAMGVRCSRWVTMHGFAFNVNTDLDYFNYIVPCGIIDKGVTSLQKELGKTIDINEVKEKIKFHFSKIFNAQLIENNYVAQ